MDAHNVLVRGQKKMCKCFWALGLLTSRSSLSFSSERFGTSISPLYLIPDFEVPIERRINIRLKRWKKKKCSLQGVFLTRLENTDTQNIALNKSKLYWWKTRYSFIPVFKMLKDRYLCAYHLIHHYTIASHS